MNRERMVQNKVPTPENMVKDIRDQIEQLNELAVDLESGIIDTKNAHLFSFVARDRSEHGEVKISTQCSGSTAFIVCVIKNLLLLQQPATVKKAIEEYVEALTKPSEGESS